MGKVTCALMPSAEALMAPLAPSALAAALSAAALRLSDADECERLRGRRFHEILNSEVAGETR